jgi:SAM-dependent methyltransferase
LPKSIIFEDVYGMSNITSCRSCGHTGFYNFLDLGKQPLANSYLSEGNLQDPEPLHSLNAMVCSQCFLAQLDHNVNAEHIFNEDYAYFSSFSDTWLDHCRAYALKMMSLLQLSHDSLVIEVASNDGYMLKNFVAAGIPVLGVEPSANTARAAEEIGVSTRVDFFNAATGRALAAEGLQADLIAAKNVMAHVPDLADFVAGFKAALKPQGCITVEFPHLLRQIEQLQFDTIYHEHYSYLSLLAVEYAFQEAGLRVFDVEELPTHGGSLRIFGCHDDAPFGATDALQRVRQMEDAAGLSTKAAYADFARRVEECRSSFVAFLLQARSEGKRIAAYGAAAKGNTFLNYAGADANDITFVVDRSPHKQGKFLPGSRIPIMAPEAILKYKPDYVLVLPWNLWDEITEQMISVREWGGKFVRAVPVIQFG